jgi:UDPglucose--hexose-1-phosphate uridylyltransferase
MSHNELRKDYLLNRWVVIATERSRRPSDFAKNVEQNKPTSICPLCVGNEHMTPPAILLYLKSSNGLERAKDQNGSRRKDWLVRCIPNLYPAFSVPKEDGDEERLLKRDNFGLAIGHHEVLVESPFHDDHPSNVNLGQLTLLINMYIDRLRELSTKPYVQYVSIFRNYRLEAGASLSHAHSQIITTPFVPKNVQEELDASKNYWEQTQRCIVCDLVKQESASPRLIIENPSFIVIAPYASVHPMEFWIIPKRHANNFVGLTEDEKKTFADSLKETLKALKDLVNDPPYNYGFHLSIDPESGQYYHWHLEVYPRLAVWAGFEKNTGMYINTIPPETAAAEYRKTLYLCKS